MLGTLLALTWAAQAGQVATCTDAPGDGTNVVEWARARTVSITSGDTTGTGVVVSPDGFVLTAAHVIDSDAPEVAFVDGPHRPARVVRLSHDADLALLQVEPAEGDAGGAALPCAPLQMEPAEVGSEVFVIGSPGGEALSHSVSKGIVSAWRDADGITILQTDASINPGNSGGPIFGADGHVLGVVSFKVVAQGFEGLGFGVASSNVPEALDVTFADATDDEMRSATATVGLARSDFMPEVVPGPGVTLDTAVRYDMNYRIQTGRLITGAIFAAAGAWAVRETNQVYLNAKDDREPIAKSDWALLVAANAGGWLLLGTGALTIGVSFTPSSNGKIVIRSQQP